MMRLNDWETRLHALIGTVETRPYAYGSWDCCLWAAAAVRAQTGVDFARGMRGRYRSAATSARFLRSLGFADIPALVTARLGAPIAPLQAHRGDIVWDGARLGVLWGRAALFVGQEGDRPGLVQMRTPLAAAWAVGR